MKTKAIIFDKDGTLIDFNDFWLPISYSAIRDILREIKREDIHIEEILSALGVENGITNINGVLCRGTYSQMGQKIYSVLTNYGCDLNSDKITKLTIDAYHHNFPKGVIKPACDNISQVLSRLKNLGIKLAVVTTDDSFLTKKCLQTLGIDEFFEYIY